MNVVVIEGDDLRRLLDLFDVPAGRAKSIYRLSVAIDDGRFKVKINEFMWTPPYGGCYDCARCGRRADGAN